MGRGSGVGAAVCFWLAAWAALGQAWEAAAQTCERPAARMVSVQGTVEVQGAGNAGWRPVRRDDSLCPGDTIRVLDNSRADVSLMDRSFLRVNENTTIVLDTVLEERTSLIDLLKGAAHFLSREPRSVEVKTRFAIFGVRGTEFLVRVEEDQAFLTVFAGAVQAKNPQGDLTLTDGQSASVRQGRAPVIQVVARPRDAVQWALYYPPVLYDLPPGLLDADPAGIVDPRVLAQRAALLLEVGRVPEAAADLERALGINPDDGDALALQAIIAIVKNEKDAALAWAQRAVDADPRSAAAWIALSYARQARFDLEGARAALESAVGAAPDNALAWARMADVHASFGDLDKALDAARKAESLAPDLSLTQTVLGFAYLTQVKLEPALAAFEKAIALDEAAPLPRLGLGLAKIRRGDLAAGGREMEVAASLDPNNSIIRSYLGKTYYEEKRMPLDEREYQIAKELDPNDPTPWFYGAIAKQTTNRPVEALGDLQEAISLNDNRLVHRSKLLLDSDLAARSASLAKIYDNLGFRNLALSEGYRAANVDPGNFSAHRFLADAYASQPRHEIARVSELLRSQLLQPINITPIQPRQAETNLLLIGSSGPSAPSFSEFNPLFNRNRAALQVAGLAGENSTWAAEGVASGIYERLSLSAGYDHFETDGWRDNADQTDDIYNFFAQYQISYQTSVQAEWRHREIDQGQLEQFFDPGLSQEFRRKRDVDNFRLGLRQTFSPGNDVIASYIYQDIDIDQRQIAREIPVQTDFDEDTDGYQAELQHLFRWEDLHLTSGVGHIDRNYDENTTIDTPPITIAPPFPGFPPIVVDPDPVRVSADGQIDRTNVYSYLQVQMFESLNLTLGFSIDDLDITNQIDNNQFNPKFGIAWDITPETVIRGAAFRERGVRLDFSQTIEPTQVAGFNQFFDDINGTDAWRYGIAMDHQFSDNLFAGAEYSERDLDVPLLGEGEAEYFDWREQQGRVYLYGTLGSRWAYSAEYDYERFDRKDNPFRRGIVDVKTHKVPLGVRYFHPSGLSLGVKGTYVDQSGTFNKRDSNDEFSDSDDFWLVDMSVNYRLPKRFGIVSVGVNNLFDEDFNFQETDQNNTTMIPDRYFFTQLTLSF